MRALKKRNGVFWRAAEWSAVMAALSWLLLWVWSGAKWQRLARRGSRA